jgi:Cu+-exporting ATPase
MRATIRSNLVFAATYNTIGMTLAATGWLHPIAAAILMLAFSLTVTLRAGIGK